MHLNSKQFFALLFPFIVAVIIFVFSNEIVQNMRYFFASYEDYSNNTLNSKADIYLKIEEKSKKYLEIQNKLELRKSNREWIVKNMLYNKENGTQLNLQKEIIQTDKVAEKSFVYKLEMIYPKAKVALINEKIIHESETIDGAKVIKISNDGVLIEYQKGLKWLTLFR
ncbi:MAG: hypothetical protein NTW78_06265 [Campylobacterales bacterium]|nr:hypothetical protein [Campylobacterales bacterium]